MVGSLGLLLAASSLLGIGWQGGSLLLMSIGTPCLMSARRHAGTSTWVLWLSTGMWLTLTLVTPGLQPYRALTHLILVLALVWEGVRYHRFLVQGLHHARVRLQAV